MSSIIACMLPDGCVPLVVPLVAPPVLTPVTGRGVLSSDVSPMDWASRLAGSTVRTTTCRPRSAARSPTAAAMVVLPTPPEPQQTMILVRRSSMSWSTTSGTGLVLIGFRSRGALLPQSLRQPVQRRQVDPVGDQRQFVARLPGLIELAAQGALRAGRSCLVCELVGEIGGQP